MWLDSLAQDVRYAVRSYAKAPSFTAVVLITLALGIGASTAIFSMVNAILLQPLPLPSPERLVFATELNPRGDGMSVSWPNFLDWRARVRSVDALAASRDEPLTLAGTERAERLRGRRVTGNFFQVIGVPPELGRGLSDGDDRAGADPVVIVSDDFWRTKLGGDRSAVGRTLRLDDIPYTIVGIMPRGFEYLRPYDVFVSISPIVASPMLLSRGNHNGFFALGRLRPSVSVDAASRELQDIEAVLEREHPDTNSGVRVRAELLSDRVVTDVRLTLLTLFGAVGFLLLIACVNVANLLIARSASRQHELAVRAALGCGRRRLITQLLVESTLISIVGGAAGVAVGSWLLRALVAVAPEATPRLASVQLDGRALLFAFGAAAVCGVVFGAFPAFQASAVHGQQALVRGRAVGFAVRSHRLRRGLMIAETALALVLLTGAGLMIRTLQQLTRVGTGFRADHLLTARFTLAGDQWTRERRRPFYAELESRIRTLPGVTSAAFAYSLPIDGSQWNSIFIVGDKPVPLRAQLPIAAFIPVSAGYFETMRTRLVKGRVFDARDSADAPTTLIANESLARRLWPGEDPIGKRLKQGWPEQQSPWREVIGVVADVKLNGVAEDTPMQAYLPLTQEPTAEAALLVRTAVEPKSIVESVQDAVRGLNRDLPLYLTRTMDEVLERSLSQQRMSMLVFVVFAAVALILAAAGLYGVIAHSVSERTHEIGVRMALGADARQVLALVVGQGLMLTSIGTVAGLAGAVVLSRWIEGLLFGVSPTDPLTFAAVIAVLVAVATAACSIPAWRATRVDPTQALRAE